MRLSLLCCLVFFGIQGTAHAYIGPGLAAGTLGVIIAFVGSIFLGLFAIIWYPAKRLLKRRKKSSETKSSVSEKP